MLLIWGTRRTVQTILMLTMLCGRCGNPAAHAVKHLVTKFTFFFIPLFPISSRYLTQCTFCGHSQRATKEQVEQMKLSQQPSVSEYPQHGGLPTQAPQSAGMPALPPGQAPQPQPGAAPGYPHGNAMPAPQSGEMPVQHPQGHAMPGQPQSGGMPVQQPNPQWGGQPGQSYPQGAGQAQQYPPQSPPAAR